MTKYFIKPLLFKNRACSVLNNFMFLWGYSSSFHAYQCKKDPASASGKRLLFFMNMCMHDELGFLDLKKSCLDYFLDSLHSDW